MSSVMLANGQQVRLGRVRPKARPMCPRFGSYYSAAADAAPPPDKIDYYTKAMPAIRRMYCNDQLGCCVIAGKAHQVGLWTGNDGGPVVEATDAEIRAVYFHFSPNDQGCVISEVLDFMKANGLKFGGAPRKIDGYVQVDWSNKVEVQVALDVFGSLTIGVNLPAAWANTHDGGLWDTTNSEIVGGHDVCCVGYDDTGVQIATWGGLRTITWQAFRDHRWVEECYAELSPDWYGSDKLAPNGIAADALKADLDKLGGGTIPPLDPTPPPVPPAPPAPPQPPEPPLSQSFDVVLAGEFPAGLWGHMTPVRLTGKATPGAAALAGPVGFGLLDILSLLRQYGPIILPLIHKYGPLVAEVLAIIKAGGFGKLSTVQIVEWVTATIEAVLGGQPLPPLPA